MAAATELSFYRAGVCAEAIGNSETAWPWANRESQLEAFMQQRGITSQMALAKTLEISQPMAGRLLSGEAPTRKMLERILPQLNMPE
jgi:hypothetical protein